MKERLIGTLKYYELEHQNNIRNHIMTLREIETLLPGIIAAMRIRAEGFEGEFDEQTEESITEWLNSIKTALSDIFNAVESANISVEAWKNEVDSIPFKGVEPQPDPVPEPDPVEYDEGDSDSDSDAPQEY